MDSGCLVCLIPPSVFNSDSFETYRCLDDALKICMCFGYNPQVNFDTFSQFELSRFSGIYTMKVNGHCVPYVQTPPSVLF